MDEPLSNLDARLREQMRVELKKITKSIGVTTLYVTHDQAEALSLGDKVCVMNQGEILQIAAPNDIYVRPANLFVAQFVGEMNFVKAAWHGPDKIESPLGVIAASRAASASIIGAAVTLAIRPEHVEVTSLRERGPDAVTRSSGDPQLLGRLRLARSRSERRDHTRQARRRYDLDVGQNAVVDLPAHRWHVCFLEAVGSISCR